MIMTTEYKTRADGVRLFRSRSDRGVIIQKSGTEELYAEAVDVEGAGHTYLETDAPAPQEPVTLTDTIRMLGELGVAIDDEV